jgi:hypothetical protein
MVCLSVRARRRSSSETLESAIADRADGSFRSISTRSTADADDEASSKLLSPSSLISRSPKPCFSDVIEAAEADSSVWNQSFVLGVRGIESFSSVQSSRGPKKLYSVAVGGLGKV